MPTLVPYAVRPDDVGAYRNALGQALEGTGPALALDSAALPDGPLPDDLALVVSTSGSTGSPKRAMLTAAALRASADATHERLGGPGQWLLAMPAHHIAGTQVIIRSLRAGTDLLVLDRFDVDGFVSRTAQLTEERAYTSVVPTQLGRLLDAAPESLRRYAGILLGGAAASPTLLARAADAGVSVLTTYGMSETAGGCVYDGVPLAGVSVELEEDGRITLAGPTIAHGYLADPERTEAAFDLSTPLRRFRTDDLGEVRDGVLRVLGRRDDVIVTGGLKVAPQVVQDAAAALPGVADAVALALPDPEWGQVVALAVVPTRFGHAQRGTSDPLRMSDSWTVHEVRDALRGDLPAYALPRRLLVLDALPLRGPGKPDRVALAALPGWQD
ncbi:o-succinylbenzoate--CoA ligase [Allobranchiibius sp. GilTou38]|uniref:o-succinylbenzoate--CoA ligase n=1 Tax=Allobranchiibius sp. GilTou38 TaxID=2815210 RepID=UPI001AA1C0C6|nr:o-succinylbenzoate--CoA ligase [Allobranchiibius sp. GilTou38]